MSSSSKMLIDATHPEETRVVVLRNGRVEEFDYESAARKLLRGNIYLAKVTRVEPSLQAAFVDYGGNRHGFLAFNEIHPDYYQIPVADRQALLDEEAEQEAREEAEADARAERLERRQRQHGGPRRRVDGEGLRASTSGDGGDEGEPQSSEEHVHEDGDADHADHGDSAEHETVALDADSNSADDSLTEELPEENDEPEVVGEFAGDPSEAVAAEAASSDDIDHGDVGETAPVEGADSNIELAPPPAAEPVAIESAVGEDALEELPARPRRRPRSYKIQEVIKRRQIILVQVVKEERGNKGAALTTYLSLAGRYTVLMPNTARGGGISRKITNPQDRRRLKAIASELEVPEGMGLIIRTAGAARTMQEIKRDFEYLLRLWESVRDLTLESTAPSLVYEEGNLIKRSIRDLYNKDVEEIVVAGEHAHRDAADFMRMLMPSHAKNVIAHADPEPLFTKYGIERQLNAMFSPYVTLRSGGYLVINQTEALVAVDVNSGKSTREFSIEETALNTNLEAADEVARQVKLRDLAGLVVIDFIDMEEKRNNRAVERRLKDALRFDRARIQLGHISHFGLMEMSRQRMRTGVLEGSTTQCPHCQGTGIIRSTESVALAVLRGLEDALLSGGRSSLTVSATAQVALYILNSKRAFINEMEARNGISITVQASDKLQGANFTIERGSSIAAPAARRPERAAVNMDWGFEGEEAEAGDVVESHEHESLGDDTGEGNISMAPRHDDHGDGEQGGRSDGRRGRRRRGGRRDGRDGGRDGGGREGRDRDGRNGERFAGQDRDRDRDRGGRGGRGPRRDQPRDHTRDQPAAPVPGGADFANGEGDEFDGALEAGSQGVSGEAGEHATTPQGDREERGRRRRRGRRGGRRGRGERGPRGDGANIGASDANGGDDSGGDPFSVHVGEQQVTDFASAEMGEPEKRPRRNRPERDEQPRVTEHAPAIERTAPAAEAHAVSSEPAAAAETQPKPRARFSNSSSEPVIESVVVRADGSASGSEDAPATPKRGWWQRTLG